MKRTITVICRRLCAAAILVCVVLIEQAKCGCRSDDECVKFGDTCCRNSCQPFHHCKDQDHCLDHYDCVSNNKICFKNRCVKENGPNTSETYCSYHQDCREDLASKSKGLNICCDGRCQVSCSSLELPTLNLNRSHGQKPPCIGSKCTTALNINYTSTVESPSVFRSDKKRSTVSEASQFELNLNPAIVAAIVIAGCIVLAITCICFLREKRLMRKHSAQCHRHRSHSPNSSTRPFWISRLARNSTQTRLSCGNSRDEEASVSFTQPNSSGEECCFDSLRLEQPPSYSTLTIHECPPTYEEATRTHRNQGTQVDLFI